MINSITNLSKSLSNIKIIVKLTGIKIGTWKLINRYVNNIIKTIIKYWLLNVTFIDLIFSQKFQYRLVPI